MLGELREWGVWDLSSSYGSFGLENGEKLRQGRGNVVRRGQMLLAFLGKNAGGDFGGIWAGVGSAGFGLLLVCGRA